MSAAREAELLRVRRKIEELEAQVAKLEQRAAGASVDAAIWGYLASKKDHIVELRKQHNLLLSSTPVGDELRAVISDVLREQLEPIRAQLAQLEPIRAQLAQLEPIRAQLAQLEPIRAQLAQLEPIRAQLALIRAELEPLTSITLSSYIQRWYLQPCSSSASGGSDCARSFRNELLTAYKARDNGQTWCPVTGVWWPEFADASNSTGAYVIAAHLFRRSGGLPIASDWEALMEEASVDSLANGLPMMAAIEHYFNMLQLIILPTPATLGHAEDFKVYILDAQLMDTKVYDMSKIMKNEAPTTTWNAPAADCKTVQGELATELTFGNLHGRSLQFVHVGEGALRPHKRILTWHATLALAKAKADKKKLPDGVPTIGEDHHGWTSPQVLDSLQRVATWRLEVQAANKLQADKPQAEPADDIA